MHESALLLIAAYAYYTRALALFDQPISRTPPPHHPPSSLRSTPRTSRSLISRSAVSAEHLPIAVHLAFVSLPSTPSMLRSAGARAPISAPQPPGDARSHGVQVECLAFDGAGGNDFLRQRLQCGLVALCQTQPGHAARQMPLRTVDLRQWRSQRSRVKPPMRPVGALPEVGAATFGFIRKHAVIMQFIHRFICGECVFNSLHR